MVELPEPFLDLRPGNAVIERRRIVEKNQGAPENGKADHVPGVSVNQGIDHENRQAGDAQHRSDAVGETVDDLFGQAVPGHDALFTGGGRFQGARYHKFSSPGE